MPTKLLPTSWLCAAAMFTPLAAQAQPHNVLLITVDDFRPELPAYGRTHIQAPNMDRLSNEGLTFNRAYVQQAICQPARANVLTGARPDTTEIYDVFGGGTPTFRTTMGAIDTLPSTFKNNGYWTAGYGKNFHHVDNPSWTESATFYTTEDLYQNPVNRAMAGDVNNRPPVESYNGVEDNYMDAKVANAAVDAIRDRAVDGQKFFIAAGFWKPHLPFTAPETYWDLYDRNTLPIATGPDALPVTGALPSSFYDPFSGELGTYKGGKPPFVGITAATQAALDAGTFTTNQQTGDDWGIITVNGTHIYPEDYVRELTHGYYACTSFVDAQIGKILAALEDPNDDGDTSDSILDNTIVLLWGDHGMHVGRHGSWPKHTNMDIATRIPLILHHPDMPPGTRGELTEALVESVDIMPTLLELAGLPAPSTHTLEGRSLAPLMDAPHQTWKTAAFSQYPKEVPMGSGNWYMGYAMRTNTHTYTQWREMEATDANPISLANRNFSITNTVAYEELYDMVNDPGQHENIGGDPHYRALMDALSSQVNTALSTGYANTQNVGSTTASAPEAQAVSFHGGTAVGDTLSAHYIYADANGDLESGTTLEWVSAADFNGPYDTVVGTGSTYTLQVADVDTFVKLRVTPATSIAPATGAAVLSASAVVAGVGFSDGSDQPAPESAVYEGFEYAAGTLSSASAGGRGWNGGWWGNDGLSFGANSGSVAADFTWNSLPAGYHHTPNGRAGSNGANGNNPYRQLHSSQTIDLAQNGSRYFSFLYQHNGSAPVFEYRLHANTAEVFKLQINAAGSLSLITPEGNQMDQMTLSADTAYVVLGRVQSVASGNDVLSVSIYEDGDTLPESPPVFAASVGFDSSATIDRFFFGAPFNSSNELNAYWDEFHLDSNYTSVVGNDTSGGSGDTDPEPILHLTFDEANLSDSSSANLIVSGTTTFATTDGRSHAIFNGTSNSLTVPMLRSFPDGITIAFWTLAQDSTDGMPKNAALGWAHQNGGDGTVIAPGYNNTNQHIFRTGRNAGGTMDEVSTGAPLADFLNSWVHWTITKYPASGTMKLYRDGVEAGSASGKTIIPEFVSHWSTGNAGGGFVIGNFYSNYYKGYLDDYRIYDSVLTAAEVQAVYESANIPPPPAVPVASNVSISGTAAVGETLTASYTFTYSEGSEGGSTLQWYRSDTLGGAYAPISGAASAAYTVVDGDTDKWLRFGVTPVGSDAVAGDEVFSASVTVSSATRTPGPIRVLALGDSITYGLSFGEANGQTAFPCGYRGPLQNLLQADPNFTNNFDFVGLQQSTNTNVPGLFDKSKSTDDLLRYDGHHQGHPSYTIQNNYPGNDNPPPGNLYDELVNNYSAGTFDPDIVLLHIGINDIIAQGATAASIQDDYRALVSKIYEFQPTVELYISTVMINHPNHPQYSQVLAFNDYLRNTELAHWQAQGKFIRLVDMFAALEDQGYSSTLPSTNVNYGTDAAPGDRTHPNHTGYANMAAAWNDAIDRPQTVAEPVTDFSLWSDAAYAHLEGGADHPDAAPDAIPAGTSLTNLQIFAYGGTPENPPPPPAVTPADDYPELIFSRRIDGAALPAFFHSVNLMTDPWDDTGMQILSVTPIDDTREEVRVRSPQTLTDEPLQFFAFEITAD